VLVVVGRTVLVFVGRTVLVLAGSGVLVLVGRTVLVLAGSGVLVFVGRTVLVLVGSGVLVLVGRTVLVFVGRGVLVGGTRVGVDVAVGVAVAAVTRQAGSAASYKPFPSLSKPVVPNVLSSPLASHGFVGLFGRVASGVK